MTERHLKQSEVDKIFDIISKKQALNKDEFKKVVSEIIEIKADLPKCERCGKEDLDLRTLWMACMYDMSELPIPLKETAIIGQVAEITGQKNISFLQKSVPIFSKKEAQKDDTYRFFTLRVCKYCRAEWMSHIHSWYKED